MGTALEIRRAYTAADLRQLARDCRDADLSRRLLALSVIYDGGSRSQAASMGGVGLQIIRDWVERFNRDGPDGLKTEGQRSRAAAERPAAQGACRGGRESAQGRPTYIFGAICLKRGKAAALIMPWCDTYAMTLHLAEISRHVGDDAHAILIMDQAGWHMSNNLVVPANITILPLPPKSPELNPVENLWQFMRENWLSNRVFKSYDDIVDHCCDAWRKLENQPWRIMSIGYRKWAYEF